MRLDKIRKKMLTALHNEKQRLSKKMGEVEHLISAFGDKIAARRNKRTGKKRTISASARRRMRMGQLARRKRERAAKKGGH